MTPTTSRRRRPPTATVHTPTTLTVSAGTSDFADAGTVSGVLTNSITGAVIPGESVTLTLNGTQSCSATTNAKGVASCSITPNEPAATYTLAGSFAGDTTKAPQLLASTGSNHYVVTLEETAIAYTGPSVAVTGMPFTLSANLTTDGNPLGGRTVLMTLGSGSTAQSCTGTTNAAGNASCTIADANQVAGSAPIAVSFAGDAYYRPANASGCESKVTVAAAPSSGGFVVGDVTAGAPTNGTQVNFWGSQYWKNNSFSGVVNAPASMKGYIANAPGFACGVNWTSNPGNSSNPPSTIPVNMLVVVVEHHHPVRVHRVGQHQAPRRGVGPAGVRPQSGTRRIGPDHRHDLLSGRGRRGAPGRAFRGAAANGPGRGRPRRGRPLLVRAGPP